MIWFRAKTSLWHLWRLTPEGREGKQWTECLRVIENPVVYVETIPRPKRGYFRPRVCDNCADFARYVREQAG